MRDRFAQLSALTLAFCAFASTASARFARAENTSIREVLERASDDARTRNDVVGQLAALGPASVPQLFALYTAGDVAFLETAAEAEGEGETEWWCRPDGFGDLALHALGQMPSEPVVEYLRGVATGEDLDVTLAAARVLGVVGTAGGLELLLELVERTPASVSRSRTVRTAFADAVAATLRADRSSARALGSRLAELDERQRRTVAEGARAFARPETASLLESLIESDPETSYIAVTAFGELAVRFPWRVQGAEFALRRTLDHEDAGVRSAAAVALAHAGDSDSVESLLFLLDDPEPGPRRSANFALRALSGKDSLSTPSQWSAWYAGERSFWSEHGDRLLEEIASAEPERVSTAVRELSRHPLFHSVLGEALGAALVRLDPRFVPRFCDVLERLDARHAVPGLRDVMLTRGAGTRARVAATLCALTGESFGVGPNAWTSYVDD